MIIVDRRFSSEIDCVLTGHALEEDVAAAACDPRVCLASILTVSRIFFAVPGN